MQMIVEPHRYQLGAALLSLPLFLISPEEAKCTGCGDPVTIPVEFASGKKCWYYSGIGTEFPTTLGQGQSVFVRMLDDTGQPLSPNVDGPNGFTLMPELADDSGEFEFQTKAAGTYAISFFPCAAWGGVVKIEICAK